MDNRMPQRLPTPLRTARRHWTLRGLAPYIALALLALLLGQVSYSLLQWPLWTGIGAAMLAGLGALLDHHWRPDPRYLCRLLDRRYPELQDSSALLLEAPESLPPLVRLQQQRTRVALEQLVAGEALQRFRPRRWRPAIGATLALCIAVLLAPLMTAAISLWGGKHPGPGAPAAVPGTAGNEGPGIIRIASAKVRVSPPAYTGLPERQQPLQVRAPESARARWTVILTAPVQRLQMQAADADFDFQPQGELPTLAWTLERRLTESDFYQLAVTRDGGEILLPEIHNIEVIPDRAPQFEFSLPRDSLTVVNTAMVSGDAALQVLVTAEDDFQITDTALVVTLASGNGENVRFRNERIPLQPISGSGQRQRFEFQVPVDRFAIEPGDELYWFVEARDNRTPAANVARSQHFILRWQQEEIFGLSDAEGMAIKVMPEYFRSQRQLIIDTEALLAEQPEISPGEFRNRATSLAHEQNLLRMRYGKFLGEEDSALEAHDDDRMAHDESDNPEHEGGHGDTDGHHDHHAGEGAVSSAASQGEAPQFGDAAGIVESVGHQHDNSEHATLFDPQTKELLRSALNAMWSAWRELSIVEPQASLPHQHRALRFIKEVQQASRIYLQRVGFEPPPVDEGRRLTGEREEVAPPQVIASFDDPDRTLLESTLRSLMAGNTPADRDLAMLPELIQAGEQQATRQLEVGKALRRFRQDPACGQCRRELQAQLYQLLAPPTAAPALPTSGTGNDSYADWIQATQPRDAQPEQSGGMP
ncbi:hypothetical protein AWR36_010815 [Microbulbifer flavimaris]|uniref:DUF4175 domain-containing protein n=1 Tax=Microbulbifer flavimaris TaxID=1781068 RepID=A0ABX4HZT0_9GAMM|nr:MULTISPECIES: hypothetical protein [Microbulbifer]KUJ83023.1 hypothetical protein AVO43_10795 [Microbulbifer sp. ZGT114]PCO05207.1 hypothetical protein AWR36_010815 [Microbulbifer flavimaris]